MRKGAWPISPACLLPQTFVSGSPRVGGVGPAPAETQPSATKPRGVRAEGFFSCSSPGFLSEVQADKRSVAC